MLTLRPYRASDQTEFCQLVTEQDTMGQVDGPLSLEEAQSSLDSFVAGPNERFFDAWAVEWNDAYIGHAAIARSDVPDAGEVGFIIKRGFWGQGLGTAVARVLVKEAAELGVKVLIATIDNGNGAAKTILSKCGFELERTDLDATGPYAVYTLTLVSPSEQQ